MPINEIGSGSGLRAEIVTTGTELLLGEIVDTNAAWMAQQLRDIGVNLYDRPEDAELENDRERELGDPAEVHGLEATAISGTFQQQLSDTDNAGYLVVDVKLENAASGTTSYDRLDWVLQLPDGTTKNRIAAAGQPDQMEGGDLERDQTLQGKVYFQIGTQRGAFYVLYAPRRAARTNDTEKERGVWQVTVE